MIFYHLFFFLCFRSRQILDDFREAYYWLSQNTHDDARVMSWWDYGYQVNLLDSTLLFNDDLHFYGQIIP
jgi:hypothetical protein